MPPAPFKFEKPPREMVWRSGDNPKTKAIEATTITILHDGIRSGGLMYRKGLRPTRSESVLRTYSRKGRAQSVEGIQYEQQFQNLIKNCNASQNKTQDLFFSLQSKSGSLKKDLGSIQDRLSIMRSMPDLTVSPEDLEEFIQNVRSSKPAVQGSGDDHVKGGSIRHVFPLRDWKNGGIKDHI